MYELMLGVSAKLHSHVLEAWKTSFYLKILTRAEFELKKSSPFLEESCTADWVSSPFAITFQSAD
jgi:hypothetical protein